MAEQAKNFRPGQSSSPKYAGGGLKKPSYTGADRARSSSKASQGKQASNYRHGMGHSGGGGGATAKYGKGYPGSGPMASGSAGGQDSYPTRNSSVRQATSGPKYTTKNSAVRSSRRGM